MGRSPKVEVEPTILRWARESAGVETATAARRAGATPARIEEWEQGISSPTIKQLRKLGKAYMCSIGLFFLSELPEDPESIRDFRKIPDELREEMSPALRFEIRLAWDRRDEALELMADLDEEPARIEGHFSIADDPDQVAAKLRRMLNIPVLEQQRWRDRYEAFNSWRQAIEGKGVLVFQTGILRNLTVHPEEARGFSIAEQPYPVIVVTGKDHPTARCFTLIHELTHILVDEGGICQDFAHRFGRATSQIDRTEVFCNRVAASTLVPSDALLRSDVVRGHARRVEWSDAELGALARSFWVSWEVILRRLLTLGRTSKDFYQRWRQEKRDLFPGGETTSGSRVPILIPMPRRVVIKNGELFPALVLRALRNGRITCARAADILWAGPDRLRDIEMAIF